MLIRDDGPTTEPHSTGDKPDKIIILFRHYVRAMLIPALAHVVDTQAGFKAFDARGGRETRWTQDGRRGTTMDASTASQVRSRVPRLTPCLGHSGAASR